MTVDINNPVHRKFVEAGLESARQISRGGGIKGRKAQLGKDDFMKILMAEVKNQDPFDPMDTKEYGNQLAQFSQLEQMVNMNTKLEGINSGRGIQHRNELVAYIGKEVHAKNDTFDFASGKDSVLPFNLEKDAASVTVKIFDEKSKEVAVIDSGGKPAGEMNVRWDGRDKDGVILNDGKFRYEIVAKNVFGVDVPVNTYLKGIVTGVSFEENRPVLILGKYRVDADKVMSVLAAKMVERTSVVESENATADKKVKGGGKK